MIGYPRQLIAYLCECDQDKRFELKEKRERRSLTQNAYYWAMLNKLARALHMPDGEVHLNMLRDWGVSEVFVVSKEVPLDDYFKYYDRLSVIGDAVTVKVYKRSSQMDSAEFSQLIEGMREECEAQGIDVMTPEEIARLDFLEPKED